jgi:hypothetical protein
MEEDRPDHLVGHLLVLGREGVDRRTDDPGALRVAARRDVLAPGEDGRVRVAQIRLEEAPGAPRERRITGIVPADVAAPGDDGARVTHGGDEPGRLGVVEDDQVAGAQQGLELDAVGGEHLLVDAPLGVSELAAVSRVLVQ